MRLSESLKQSYCELYFDHFFTSPWLVEKLLSQGVYGTGTVRASRKQMPTALPSDKEMKRGDIKFLHSKSVTAVKWFDNRGVLLLSANVDGVDDISSVQRRVKKQASKITLPCPQLVKSYNAGMGGVDLLDQRTASYRLDRKSRTRFYLRLIFDILDMSCVNAFIAYNTLNPNVMSFLDVKISVGKAMIGVYTNRERNPPSYRSTKNDRLSSASMPAQLPQHIPTFGAKRQRCYYCRNEGVESKTKIYCSSCNKYFCISEGRNCVEKHHYKQ